MTSQCVIMQRRKLMTSGETITWKRVDLCLLNSCCSSWSQPSDRRGLTVLSQPAIFLHALLLGMAAQRNISASTRPPRLASPRLASPRLASPRCQPLRVWPALRVSRAACCTWYRLSKKQPAQICDCQTRKTDTNFPVGRGHVGGVRRSCCGQIVTQRRISHAETTTKGFFFLNGPQRLYFAKMNASGKENSS